MKRAEKAGFKALVLTVDAPKFGVRHADAKNKFKLPPHLKMANFKGEKATKINESKGGSGLSEYVNSLFDQSLTWKDIKWLKRFVLQDSLVSSTLRYLQTVWSTYTVRKV